MVNCFGCGELVNTRDKFCRWCGRTISLDGYQQRQPGAALYAAQTGRQTVRHILANGQLCPQCHPTGKFDDIEKEEKDLNIMRRLFQDQAEEILSNRVQLKDPALVR
jgi:hypothetical protein